jgi:hypothetical protein
MPLLHRLSLLALASLGAVLFAAPSFAARPVPADIPSAQIDALPFTLLSPHFAVHYQSDLIGDPARWAITQTTAGDIAALAERALAAETAAGYAPPMSDGVLGGDARTDIYVEDLSAYIKDQSKLGALDVTVPDDAAALQTSSYIVLAGDQPKLALGQHTIAREVFHTILLSIWQPRRPLLSTDINDYWLLEGSAEWMGFLVEPNDISIGLKFGPPDMALDCRDPIGTNQCDFNDYANNGYSRWAFFEYLSETYGPSFVRRVFELGPSAGSAVKAVDNALVEKGTTLAATYNAWTLFDLLGSYTPAGLQGIPPLVYHQLETGIKPPPKPQIVKVPVNHLSTRIVQFNRGDGDPTQACYEATLSLTVAMPAGTLSKPVFWWNANGSAPVALTIVGSNAFAPIPWDTCTWGANSGYLSIPNASADTPSTSKVDAADFVVTWNMSVDTSKPVSVIDPPGPVTVSGPVVAVDNGEVAPTVVVEGSVVLRLAAKDRVLRLLVVSSGEGKLHAMLGGVDLGSPTLRAGNNDVRFTLPVSTLTALRRSASNNVLTLTAFSPQATKAGASVTRRVVVPTPAKKKLHRK